MRIRAILFDLGDTIMIEESEVKDDNLTTLGAELIPDADRVLRLLSARGYRLALVADTRTGTYKNVLKQHALYDLFDAFAISEEIGMEKPDPQMFIVALAALGIDSESHNDVLMIGNNLQRDIRGANEAGLISVWFHWNSRYPVNPSDHIEQPKFEIHSMRELLTLVEALETGDVRGQESSA